MAGTYNITDFSKVAIDYIGDNGVHYTAPVRTVYQALGTINALPTPPQVGAQPFKGKLRHYWISNVYTNSKSVITTVRRKLPYNPSGTILTTGLPAGTPIDGLTGWTLHGHVGEKTRA